MATRKPLTVINGEIQQLPIADTIDLTTLGTGTPSSTVVLRGDNTWGPVPLLVNPPTTQQALTSGITIDWDMSLGAAATLAFTSVTSATLSNPTNFVVGSYVLRITQFSTGGSTLAYGTIFKFPGGTPPVLSTAANAVDVITFHCDGTYMYGTMLKGFA